jgi:alpha-mannosidase
MGWTTITPHVGAPSVVPFQVGDGYVKTPHYILEWNASGQWTRLYDIDHEREVLAAGGLGNLLQVFEDKPLNFDAWDIDIFYQEKVRIIERLLRVETMSVGSVAAVLRFVWQYDQSEVTQDLVLYAESRRIDCVTHVDWHQQQELLKVAFAVDVRSTQATYDIQFGNVKRPTHWNTSWDMAKFEVVGHQWADLSESGYGVSLANDSKYGYDIRDNVLRLTLIKSATSPDYEADQGEHQFTYALIPHAGDFFSGDTARLAFDLNSPLMVSEGKGVPAHFCVLESQDPGVHIDALKWAEEGKRAVLRVHEYAGGHRKVAFRSDLPIRSWQTCNLMEHVEDGEVHQEPLEVHFGPYEIKTFLIEFGTP